jgi:hypothetical protein
MSDELDLDMEETLAEIRGREDDSEPEKEDIVEDEVEETDDSEEDLGDSDTDDTSEEDSTEEDDSEAPDEETDSLAPTNNHAPASWRAASKDKWAKIDPDIREEILKREEDMNRGVQSLKEKSEYGSRLTNAASPYMAMIQSKGATLESFIVGQGNTMYGLQYGTPDQKVSILRNMAGMAGIDLANIQPPSEIERQLSPYMQKIQHLEQQINQQNQAATSQQDMSINQALTAFETEIDEKGGLTHPYFANVQNEMIAHIPLIRQNNPHFSHAEVLQQAYDNSIWANPDTRKQIQIQQDRMAEQERKRKAKEIAAKAKKANKVNLPKKGQQASSQAEDLDGSIDEIMTAKIKEINSR